MIDAPHEAAPIDASQCANFYGIASGPLSWKYGLHPEHVERGWNFQFQVSVGSAEALGCRCHILHRPFGDLQPGDMQFDMPPVLMRDPDRRYARLVRTFDEFWGPMVASGRRVMAYYGAIQLSHGLRGLRADEWLQRVSETLRPAIEARVEIGFDASSPLAASDPHWKVLDWVRAYTGRNIWIESRPLAAHTHHHGCHCLSIDSTWTSPHFQPPLYATRQQITGDVGRLILIPQNQGEPEEEYLVRLRRELPIAVRKVQADGCIPILPDIGWLDRKIPGLFKQPPAAPSMDPVGSVQAPADDAATS